MVREEPDVGPAYPVSTSASSAPSGQLGPPHRLYAPAGGVHVSPSARKNRSAVNASDDIASLRISSGLSDTQYDDPVGDHHERRYVTQVDDYEHDADELLAPG